LAFGKPAKLEIWATLFPDTNFKKQQLIILAFFQLYGNRNFSFFFDFSSSFFLLT